MALPRTAAVSLIRRKGAVRSRDLVLAGMARAQISRLVASGELVRLSRGIYGLPARADSSGDDGLRLLAERVPETRLCLLTALRLHGLTTEAPFEIWIAIDNKGRVPKLDWPPLRVVRYSGAALDAGLERRQIAGRKLRMTNVAKTVADCFKFRQQIGLDVAIDALREALRTRAATVDDLWKYARICRVANLMRPYLEVLA